MIICSIDPGIRNLAICFLEVPEQPVFTSDDFVARAHELAEQSTILHWECVDFLAYSNYKAAVKSYTNEKLCSILCKFLKNELSKRMVPDVVFIESQPTGIRVKNMKTKVISHVLQSFFCLQGAPNIHFIHGLTKMKLCAPVNPRLKGRQRYTETKKVAVEACVSFLSQHETKPTLELFQNSAKKDDLSDTYLMALSAMVLKYFHKVKKKKASINNSLSNNEQN